MARAYRMTPARRRALRKAQLASARKRRGKGKGKLAAANRRSRRNRRIAIGVGSALAVASFAGGYAAGNKARKARKKAMTRPSAFNPTHQLALPPGRSVTRVKSSGRRPVPPRKGVFKVNSQGEIRYIKRPRPLYDRARRAGIVAGYERKPRPKKYKKRAR